MRLRTSTKIVWNSVFMVLAIAYLYLFLSLDSNKRLYTKLGAYLTSQHQAQYQHGYSEASKALDEGNTETAIRTLRDWQDVLKGDRAFSQKRMLLHRLAVLLHEQNRAPELLDWANKWRALDSRDITAKAYYFEALRLSPEFHAEGLKGLALTYQHFPKNQQLAEFYANSLRETGDFAAADKIQKSNVVQQMLNWELFWDMGQGFNATARSKVEVKPTLPNRAQHINFALPAKTRKFRLDLPASSSMALSNLSVRINGQQYPINPNTFKLVMMQYSEGLFISTGEPDPHIIFDLNNSELSLVGVLNLEISFVISPTNQHHRAKQS